jgi:hypothetical protein
MHGTKVPTRGTGRDPLSTGLRTLIVESGDASNAWLELATYLAALPEAYDVTWDSRISLLHRKKSQGLGARVDAR